MHRLHARLQQARSTFWVLPAFAIILGIVLGLVIPMVDLHIDLPDAVSFSGEEDTARTVLTVVATIGVSTAGVSFSILVVALVLAAQQLSPRVLGSFQRHALNQAVLAMLLGTAIFALFVLGSVGETREQPVPETAVTLAMVLTAASVGLFVVFLHHAVRSLNASVVIRRIAAEGQEALKLPYPAGVGEGAKRGERWEPTGRSREVRAPRAGYIASIDGRQLLDWASRNEAFVEQRRSVGDFAVTGSVLAAVYGGGDDLEEIADAFLLEEERVIEGDVAFPIRQLADIALKGLSPGINDPTTAENAMDSVADTLVRFAGIDVPSPLRVDDGGVGRLLARPPALDDLVRLGFDQVRRDAADRPSFATRLLELLADIRQAGETCDEIDRQAKLICSHASGLADTQADQQLVVESYERLHGRAAGT